MQWIEVHDREAPYPSRHSRLIENNINTQMVDGGSEGQHVTGSRPPANRDYIGGKTRPPPVVPPEAPGRFLIKAEPAVLMPILTVK